MIPKREKRRTAVRYSLRVPTVHLRASEMVCLTKPGTTWAITIEGGYGFEPNNYRQRWFECRDVRDVVDTFRVYYPEFAKFDVEVNMLPVPDGYKRYMKSLGHQVDVMVA